MEKLLKTIVTETQQEIRTTIDRDDEGFVVEVLACPPLDDELRDGFHDSIDTLGNGSVNVRSRTDYSNQGNETWQTVTVTFEREDQLLAIDILEQVTSVGEEYYQRQLERELAREEDEDEFRWRQANQQLYFEDEKLEEFCLLFRGKLGIF